MRAQPSFVTLRMRVYPLPSNIFTRMLKTINHQVDMRAHNCLIYLELYVEGFTRRAASPFTILVFKKNQRKTKTELM